MGAVSPHPSLACPCHIHTRVQEEMGDLNPGVRQGAGAAWEGLWNRALSCARGAHRPGGESWAGNTPPPPLAFVDPGLGCELPASRRVCVRVSVSLGHVCAAYRVVWCRVAPSLGASVRPSHNRVCFTTRGASP